MAHLNDNHNLHHNWIEEEEEQLLEARARYPHRRDWVDRIRHDPNFEQFFGHMSVDAIRSKYRSLISEGAVLPIVANVADPVIPLPIHYWTEEEDQMLLQSRQQYPGRNQWRRIQNDAIYEPFFANMTIDAMRSRYRKLLDMDVNQINAGLDKEEENLDQEDQVEINEDEDQEDPGYVPDQPLISDDEIDLAVNQMDVEEDEDWDQEDEDEFDEDEGEDKDPSYAPDQPLISDDGIDLAVNQMDAEEEEDWNEEEEDEYDEDEGEDKDPSYVPDQPSISDDESDSSNT